MSDENTFTSTSEQGYGSRIGDSFKGALVGIVLLLAGIVGLFWNEGNFVQTRKALEEAEGQVEPLANVQSVDAAQEGKLVYLTGVATSTETLLDPLFKMKHQGIQLKRQVQFYQWVEESEQKEEKELGGGATTTTVYNYKKIWTDSPVDSSSFNQKDKYTNTLALNGCENQTYCATQVDVGAFTLNASQIHQIDKTVSFRIPEDYQLPLTLKSSVKAEMQGDMVYITKKAKWSKAAASEPQVGDMKVSWVAVAPQEDVSLIAQQKGKSFIPYVAKNGTQISLMELGTLSCAQLFDSAHSQNSVQLWIFRIVGCIAVIIGLGLFSAPLSRLAGVIPFMEGLVGAVTWFAAIVLGLLISLIVIAIAWLFYRPLIALLIFAFVGLMIYFWLKKKKGSAPAASA